MTSDVVLSAAMRSNLLSLQSTSNSIDVSQTRLSTGKKINSALDGPQAFFASKALTNRAADLTKLLDSVGQSIQIIKAADNGITALTSLVEQADSIATQAQDALAAGTAEAKAVGDKDLRGINDLSTVPGLSAATTLTLAVTKEDGTAQQIAAYGAAGAANVTITIAANMSTDQLLASINDIRVNTGAAGANAIGDQAFQASLNDKGQLEIKSLNGGNYSLSFGGGASDAADLAGANALGFGKQALITGNATDATTTTVGFTASADVALTSYALTKNTDGDVADRSTLLSAVRNGDASGNPLLFNELDDAADLYSIAVNGGARQTIGLNNQTIQGFIDSINNNTTLNSKIEASFDDATGQLSIKAIAADVRGIEIGVVGESATTANFGFGTSAMVSAGTAATYENIQLGAGAGQLAKLEQDFNKIRDQMTALVENGDTAYRGTNLLNGDNLLTAFNEDRTSTIETKGVKFTADGLGLEKANFARADTVTDALNQVRDALASVREFGSTLANDLSVIQTRQTFINNTVNTLKEGSDKLVNADQNEEGAKLLALQTRQSLGVTALSLASQSQQSILRLF